MSDTLRLSGLASGIDTDSMIQKLLKVEQTKVDNVKKDRDYTEWQREDYREISTLLSGFQSTYFDYLNSSTNLRSATAFNIFAASASISGTATTAVSVSASSSATKGSFTIGSVTQLATKDKYESGSEVVSNVKTGTLSSISNINSKIDLNNKLTFEFDGVKKTIELSTTDYVNNTALATQLTTHLKEAFGNVDITAEVTGAGLDEIEFKIYEKGTTTEELGHTFTVGSTNPELLQAINLTSGDSNVVNLNRSLSQMFGTSGDSSLTINGETFTFADTTTISKVMDTINNSDAGVSISYDSYNDKFTLLSNDYGSNGDISVTDTSGLLANFKLAGGAEVHTASKNAIFEINGVSTTRSTNEFEYNGTTITLNEIPTGAVNVNIDVDTTDVKDMIVKFVEKYNEVLKTINDKIYETKSYDYQPLTADERDAMSETEIENWEKQARKGTLSNDPTLKNITTSLRQALYESVEGLGITLYDLGIQSTSNYKEQGQLTINEAKLDKALKERPNEVIALFTTESDVDYTDTANRSTRYKQNGLANRLNDIIQNNIRITSDSDGRKGYLIEKAGRTTGVDVSSDLAKKIATMDEKIDRLLELLSDHEDNYYYQFAKMESALGQLNSQSSWLAQQFG